MAYNVKSNNKTVTDGKVRKKRYRFPSGWTKNVLKSFGYSSYDVISELMPNVIKVGSSAREASNELKDAFSLAKEKTHEGIDFGKKKLQEFKDTELKEAMEDLRSGKFYNKERIQEKDDASFGDFGLNFDDSFDSELDFGDDVSGNMTSTDDNTFVGVDLNIGGDSPIVQSQDATTAAVVSSTQVVATTTKESSAALSAVVASLSATMSTKMDLFTSELSKLSTTVPEIMSSQAVLRSEYYEKSLSYQERMVLALENLNAAYHGANGLSGIEPANRFDDPRLKSTLSDKMYFDVDQYKDMVKDNAKSFAQNSMIGMMLSQVIDMYKMQNEMGAGDNRGILAKGLNAAVKTAIPGAVKGVMKTLDEFVDGMVLPIGMKIAELSKKWGNPILSAIGNIFGIKTSAQTSATKNTYNKGAVAFDGKVHRAITDVIPTYLRMIASAITGKEEIAFDYEKGVFNTVSNMKKKFEEEIRREATIPQSTQISRFGNSVNRVDNLSDSQKKQLTDTFEDLMYKMANDGGYISFRKQGDRDDIARLLNKSSDDPIVQFIRNYFEAMYDEGQHADLNSIFSTSMLRSRENIDKIYKEMSVDGLSHNFHLINNGLDETQENGVKINNAPSFISDKYGRTSVSYLRDILITLNNGIKVFNVQGSGANNTVLSNSRTMLNRLTADDTSLRERFIIDGGGGNGGGGGDSPSQPSSELRYDENFINVVRDYIHENDPSDSTIDMLDNLSIFFDEDSHVGKSISEKIKRRRETNRRIRDIGNVLTGAGIDLIYGQREGSVLDRNNSNKESEQSVEIDGHTYSLGEDGKVYDDNGNPVGKKRQRRLDSISNGQIAALASGALTVDNNPANQVEKAAKSFARHAENFGDILTNKVFAPLKNALFDNENGLIRKMHDAAGSFKTTLIEKILGTKDESGMYKHGLLSGLANAPKKASNNVKSWKDALINGNINENTPEFIKKVRDFIGTESKNSVEIDGHTYSLGEDGKVYDDNGNIVGKKRQRRLDKASDGQITSLTSGNIGGKLDVKGKGKGLVAAVKAYIINKSYELTDSIFGKEEDGSHMLDRFKSDMKGNGSKIAGGAAVGLLGGLFMPFGPIGGAILASGLAIATKSTQLKDFLFGKEKENGTREDNGVISKEWQEKFKKYGKPAGIGTGVGLITSLFLPGGPLLLPVIGAMTGIATKTEAFSKILYGENGTKDDPTGGLGKYVKEHYGKDKAISDAVKDTGVGVGLGIMGSLFLPGGPLIGAILGGTMAIARKTNAWSRMLYGEDGTKDNPTGGLSKLIREHYNNDKTVNAAFIDAGIGAGVGILGSFFLPGGPLIGAILGASSSLILNSERVQEYLFGSEGEDGKRHGGFVTDFTDKINSKVKIFTDKVMDSFHETTDKLSLWMSENVINPLKVSYKPIAERIKRSLNDAKDGVKDFLFGDGKNSTRNKTKGLIGLLAENINETAFGDLKKSVRKNIIDPLEKGFRKLFNGFFSMIGSIIKAPVVAIQAIAESSEKKNGGDPKDIQRKINELNAESKRKLEERKAAREKRKAEKAKRKTPPEDRTADNTERIVTAEEQQLTEQRGFFATVTGFFNELLSDRRERRRSEKGSTDTSENIESVAANGNISNSIRKKRRNKRHNKNNINQFGGGEALPNATETNPSAILNGEDSTNAASSENIKLYDRRNGYIGKIQERYRRRQEEKDRHRQEVAARNAAARSVIKNSNSSNESSDTSNEITEDKGSLINRLDPDNRIGRNVAKIARNLDGNINGLGFNVNRIYRLLKRKLGGGGADDDNESYKNQKYYTPLQRAFRFITAPFRLVGRVVESLYTGIKKSVSITISGITKAGKLLVSGIFDVAKGMLSVAKQVIGLPVKLIGVAVDALPGILKGAANFIGKAAEGVGTAIKAAGGVVAEAAKGFGNLVSGAFTGLASMLQGLGVLGGEAIKLLAKGGAAGIKFLAKGGAFIAKGVAGAVGGVLGRLFKDKNADSSSWRNKREVIITGGKLDAIEVIKLVERVNGVSDSSENSLSNNDNNEDRLSSDNTNSTTGDKKSFKDRVREGWSTVKGRANDGYNRARDYARNKYDQATEFLRNQWNNAGGYIGSGLGQVAGFAGNFWNGAKGFTKNKWKSAKATNDGILNARADDSNDSHNTEPLNTLDSEVGSVHHSRRKRGRGRGLFGNFNDFGGFVTDVIGKLRHEISSPQVEKASTAIHVIVDGGYLNYVGGIGGSFSDKVDDDLNIEDEVEEGADKVRGAAGRGLRNRIRKFGEKLRDKGNKAVGTSGGLASNIFSRFKQEDKDAEEREWREAMLHQTREGTTTAKKSHFDWSAIFSKKGLITMALIAAVPFILKNFDKVVNFAGKAAETIGSLVSTVKSGLDKIGGLLGLGNKVGEQVSETAALVTGNSKQFVTDDNGNVVLDENGKPVTETIHQDKIKDRVNTFLNPKQTVVDEDGKVVLKDDTHVGGLRNKAVATIAKKIGKKTKKFVTAVGNTKIGKKIGEKAKGFLSKHGSSIAEKAERGIIAGGKFIKGAASKIKGAASGFISKVTKKSADDVSQVVASSKVGTIIKYCKTAVEKLIEKVQPVLKKFKADKLLSKITSIISKFSDKLFTPGVISKALGKFTKILGKMATAAGTLLASDLFWAATGAISGASRPGELFQVHEDEVDVKMTAISAIFGGILNTSWGGWVDVIDDLCLEVMGFSFVTWFAVDVVYKALASKEEEEALNVARKQFESDYTDHVDEVYDAYVKAQQAEGKAYMSKDEFKASELAPSWADYIDEQNPTFWQKTKNWFSSWTKPKAKKSKTTTTASSSAPNAVIGGKGGKPKNSQTAPSMLNGFPYMSQNDPNINTVVPMGDGTTSTLGETGCAPTAMAMVASQMKGKQVNPALLADFAAQNGLSTSADGTMPQFINASSQALGISSSLISPSSDSIKSAVSSGSPVIIQGQGNGSNTPFTPDGHYVVGVGTKDGKILVNDPEGKQYSKAYNANVLANGAANVWAFSNSPVDSFNKYSDAIANNTSSLQSMSRALLDVGNAGKEALTQDKLRQQVVDAIMSRLGKNEYTQSSKRTQVGSGYGDCSSTVRWAYMTGANIDPGGYSGAQYINKLGVDVDNTAGSPDESKLKPGDILFYKRNSSSYTDKVGHVEMYVGNGQRAGHGSGIGPKLTPLSKDAKSYLKARRFITDSTSDYDSPELGAADNATGNGTSGDMSLSSTEINNANAAIENQQTAEANGEKGTSLLGILGEWITGIKDKIQEKVFGVKPVSDSESSVMKSFGSSMMEMGNTARNAISNTTPNTNNKIVSNMMSIGNAAIGAVNPAASISNAALSIGNVGKNVAESILKPGSDYLGKYTAQFESGGRGPSTISTGKGDHGGVSFGTYQFASHNKAQADSSSALATFWNNNYASQYPGVVPGNNDAFKKAWVDAATKNPDDFSAKEAAYFGNTFYIKQRDKLADIINVDKDRGLQEATFATAVQYGPNTGVIRDALSGKNANNMNPVDAINTIEDYKASTVKKYFKSSPSIWGSLSNRFNNTERKQMTSLSGQKPVQLINTGGKGGKLNMLGGFGKGVVTDSVRSISDPTTSIDTINQFTSLPPSEDKYFKDTMNSIMELLSAIADNTLGINNGVQTMNAKEPQSVLVPNLTPTQSHNTVITPSSKNSDIDSKYYNAAKQISSGVYKRA